MFVVVVVVVVVLGGRGGGGDKNTHMYAQIGSNNSTEKLQIAVLCLKFAFVSFDVSRAVTAR